MQAYKNNPTIMSWNLINEPRCDKPNCAGLVQAWIEKQAAYVKSVDPNHLVTVGKGQALAHLHSMPNSQEPTTAATLCASSVRRTGTPSRHCSLRSQAHCSHDAVSFLSHDSKAVSVPDQVKAGAKRLHVQVRMASGMLQPAIPRPTLAAGRVQQARTLP